VKFLLGGAFEHIEPTRNPTSYVAGVVLDLTSLLKLRDAYELAINDFLAVEALPCILETEDTKGQYMLEAEAGSLEPNMQYKEKWAPHAGWKVAPHHLRAPDAYYLNRIGRPWDHLAISAVLRDRHFLASCRAFITAETTPNSET